MSYVTGYLNLGFSWFSSISLDRLELQNMSRRLPIIHLQNHHSVKFQTRQAQANPLTVPQTTPKPHTCLKFRDVITEVMGQETYHSVLSIHMS